MPITFKYNKDGILEAFDGEKSLGLVEGIGDEPMNDKPEDDDNDFEKWEEK